MGSLLIIENSGIRATSKTRPFVIRNLSLVIDLSSLSSFYIDNIKKKLVLLGVNWYKKQNEIIYWRIIWLLQLRKRV